MKVLPRVGEDELEVLIARLGPITKIVKENVIEKRQGLIGGLIGGGTSLLGNLLGGIRGDPTTTAQQRTTSIAPPANPSPTTTQAPPPTTQAPPETTQAPPAQNPPTTQAPPQTTVNNPPPVVIQPSSQPPVTAVPIQQPTSIQISISSANPLPTRTALPHLDLSLTESNRQPPTSGILPPSSLPGGSPPNSRLSSLTLINTDVPTTFRTSTLTTPTTTGGTEDLSTSNPVMENNSGRGNMTTMTIIISVVVIIFGSLAILCLAFFISKNYIKKRKITVGLAFDPRTVQTSQNPFADPAPLFSNPPGRVPLPRDPFSSPEDAFVGRSGTPGRRTPPYPPPSGPLPPLPTMKMKGRQKVERLVQKIPKPASLASIGSGRNNSL